MKLFSSIEISKFSKMTQLIVISHSGRIILEATFPSRDSYRQCLRIIDGIAKETGFPSLLAWDPENSWPSYPRATSRIIPVRIDSSDYDGYHLDSRGCEHCPPDPYYSLRRMAMAAALKYAYSAAYQNMKDVPRYITPMRTNSTQNRAGEIT